MRRNPSSSLAPKVLRSRPAPTIATSLHRNQDQLYNVHLTSILRLINEETPQMMLDAVFKRYASMQPIRSGDLEAELDEYTFDLLLLGLSTIREEFAREAKEFVSTLTRFNESFFDVYVSGGIPAVGFGAQLLASYRLNDAGCLTRM